MKIKFLGAAGTVTGSKHLIELESGKKILLDCGMYQGKGKDSFEENSHLGFNPTEIDYFILSHAHIDHSGLIPKLIKEGFDKEVHCTYATKDLCDIMLMDSAHIQEDDVAYVNKKRMREGKSPLKPLYTKVDAINAQKNFVGHHYNEWKELDEEVSFMFTDAGHILGSAAVHLRLKDKNQLKTLTFTGDIGRYLTHKRILRHPQPFPQARIIICESTYGDRLHDEEGRAKEELLQIVRETCVMKKGKLLIPAFSIGRTQDMVYLLNVLEHEGKLPKIKVFVDSPLATNATDIFRNHEECFDKKLIQFMQSDPDPFGFNGLHYTNSVDESKKINALNEPCIIISASGMMDAGRIKHHLANNIEDPKNTVLVVGYAEPSSLGGKITRGDDKVLIFGQPFDVKADVVRMDFFSAHADYEEMLRYLSCQDKDEVKNIFLVHGVEKAQLFFKEKLQEEGFFNPINIPKKGDEYHV